jgi:hypothetical protein
VITFNFTLNVPAVSYLYVGTFDNPIEQTFKTSIIFVFGESRIFHEMPPQPYVNGTWNDSDVQKAIEKHLKSLEI